MQIGLVGLGRMGANMSRRWIGAGHTVVGYARTRATVDDLVRYRGLSAGAHSLADLSASAGVAPGPVAHGPGCRRG